MSPTAKSIEDRFADTLDNVRCHFIALLRAIHDGSYFDAWLSSLLFRSALDSTAILAHELPFESRRRSAYIVEAMRCAARPVLALAPTPDRYEVRTLRAADSEQRAWALLEQRWRREIRCACANDDGSDLTKLN